MLRSTALPRSTALLSILLLLLAARASADPQSDAEKLKQEAVEILKANANHNATPEQYAECILKLEKAQHILEAAHDDDSPLAQEVSSSLFWARRFSDVHVISALEKLRAGAPPPPPVKKSPPPRPPPQKPIEEAGPDAAPPPNAAGLKAKADYETAQKFAASHAADDYAIALRWFQMANENPGTDYALKALDLARAAQERFAAKVKPAPAAPEPAPGTPEMKLIAEADALAAQGKYQESFAVYTSSLKLKETLAGHRKLALAYYKRAQQLKDEILPGIEASVAEVNREWKKAYEKRHLRSGRSYWRFNPKYPPYVAALKKNHEACKDAYKAIDLFDKAASEFRAVLKLAPGGRDLDAAGHIGVCMAVRGDAIARANARVYLAGFLADYAPQNDLERSLYEFCKTELNRISKKN